jgi:hypothetical protein
MKNDGSPAGSPRTLAVAAESLTPLARMRESLADDRNKKNMRLVVLSGKSVLCTLYFVLYREWASKILI